MNISVPNNAYCGVSFACAKSTVLIIKLCKFEIAKYCVGLLCISHLTDTMKGMSDALYCYI